jgi:hypothetical protein
MVDDLPFMLESLPTRCILVSKTLIQSVCRYIGSQLDVSEGRTLRRLHAVEAFEPCRVVDA